MASTFPTSLDTIPNSPTTEKLGESAPKHSEMHNMLRDAIVAVETRVGITGSTDPASLTYRVSADGEGAAIAALTAKTTPVDADLVGLSDSAAGGVLKKLSWSSIKTALQSVFATLAGIEGGQTLNGGTAAGETLTLRSTAHATKGNVLFGTSAYDEVNNRLGIGTTSPAAPLDVSGNIYCNNQLRLNNNTGAIATGAGNQVLYFNDTLKETRLVSLYSGGFVSIYTGSPNLERVRIDGSGNIGFGVTAASAKVHAISTTEQLRLGYDAATYLSMTVSNLGAVTYSATGGQYIFKGINSTATLGSDLVTNGSFASDLSGWTDSGSSWSWSSGTALHTPGSASTLSQNVTVTSGNTYQIELTVTGRTVGSFSVTVGSVSMIDTGATTAIGGNGAYKKTLVAADTGSVALTITPTSTFDGAIDLITVKNVTQGSVTATHVIQNSDGSIGIEVRGGGSGQSNSFVGSGSGRSVLSATGVSAFGFSALRNLSTGVNNSAFGYSSLISCTVAANNSAFGYNSSYTLTSGSNNSGFGYRSLYSTTTGSNNCALGFSALEGNTAGANNTGIGFSTLFSQSTGSNNVALGSTAGRYITDGTTANAACDNSTFIGYSTKALASGQTNQIVVGYNAIGLGSNTTVIGSSATLTFKAFGTPILTPAASSVPTVNGELTVEATSNTTLTFRLKGTDGTVRSASLTLT